jgi:hypothetical protein
MPPARLALSALPAVALFAVGFWQFPLAVIGPGFTHLPGDLVDSRFNHYVLEHGHRWLTGQQRRFWDAPFCYPAPRTIVGSDAHIGTLPVYAAARLAGADPERAYQFWWLAVTTLTFAAAYGSARAVGVGPVGAAVAAYLFAFGLPVQAKLGHPQLAPRFLVPVALAAAWRFAWRPSWKPLAVAAAATVGQFACGIYVGAFLAGILVLGAVALAAVAGRALPWGELVRPGRAEAARRGAVLAAAAGGLFLLLWPYLRSADERPATPREIVREMIPDPLAWVRPAPTAAAWGWLADRVAAVGLTEYEPEKRLFPGAVPVAGLVVGLGLAGWATARRRAGPDLVTLAAVAALVVLPVPLLVVQADGYAPYDALLGLPGVAKVRAVGRVAVVLLAPLAVTVGAAVTLAGRFRHGWVVGAGVVLLTIADQWTVPADAPVWPGLRYPMAEARERREALAEAIRRDPGPPAKAVYVFSGRDDRDHPLVPLGVQLDAMWAARDAGVPTINGWTGYPPPDWFPFHTPAELCHWLRLRDRLTDEFLAGLVLLGEPAGPPSDLDRELLAWHRRCRRP